MNTDNLCTVFEIGVHCMSLKQVNY